MSDTNSAALARLKTALAAHALGFVEADPNDVIACVEGIPAPDQRCKDLHYGASRSGKRNHRDADKRRQTYGRADLEHVVRCAEGG